MPPPQQAQSTAGVGRGWGRRRNWLLPQRQCPRGLCCQLCSYPQGTHCIWDSVRSLCAAVPRRSLPTCSLMGQDGGPGTRQFLCGISRPPGGLRPKPGSPDGAGGKSGLALESVWWLQHLISTPGGPCPITTPRGAQCPPWPLALHLPKASFRSPRAVLGPWASAPTLPPAPAALGTLPALQPLEGPLGRTRLQAQC